MSTISLHFTKRKMTQVNMLGRHVERIDGENHSNKNIDHTRTKDNIKLYGGRDKGTYYKRAKKQIERKYTGKRAIRKDAVAMVGTTVQFGGAVQGASEAEQVKVLTDCHNWLANRFGKDNILGSSIHLDETNPHLHYDFMPWKNGRLNAKNLLNRESLKSAQDELLEYVQGKYPQYDFTRISEDERGFSNGKSQEDFEKLKDIQREGVETVQEVLDYVKVSAMKMDSEWKTMQKSKADNAQRAIELDERERCLKDREDILAPKEAKLAQEQIKASQTLREGLKAIGKAEAKEKELEMRELEADKKLLEANRLNGVWKQIKEQTEILKNDMANRWERILELVRKGVLRSEQIEAKIINVKSDTRVDDINELMLELEQKLEKSKNKGIGL